jgi:hypothetical protein
MLKDFASYVTYDLIRLDRYSRIAYALNSFIYYCRVKSQIDKEA